MKIKNKSVDEKKQAFFRASQAGVVREIALNNGGTGELRKSISTKQRKARNIKNKIAKQSRKKTGERQKKS